jgi:sodium/bile acid cotransporter 3/5
MYILILGPLWLLSFRIVGAAANAVDKWDVAFNPSNLSHLLMGDAQAVEIKFNASELIGKDERIILEYEVVDPNVVAISPQRLEINQTELQQDKFPIFNVTGNFLGNTKIRFRRHALDKDVVSDYLNVTVNRVTGPLDKAFTYSVAGLVAIIYINMGAALDTRIVIDTMKKPIGPAIGIFSQFLIMPVLGYFLARWFISKASLQLGLFITGCSPGGGASNIWTLTLGGNLDLSITMTTISTLSAFIMMPLWILTLGTTITDEANLTIPYSKIATFAVALVVPLAIGIILQRTLPKAAQFLVKILKPFAVFLIIFIIVFAIYTNLYLFKLFTWEIILTGTLLPWLGYLLGGGLAMMMKQDIRDVIAIAIETGVQNTGLAIFALRFSLPQPEADLTTVLPVAVAIMTPVLPTLMLIYLKIKGHTFSKEEKKDPLFNKPVEELTPNGSCI